MVASGIDSEFGDPGKFRESRESRRPREAGPLCTEDEVSALVHLFYARVRRDEVLGPIFERHVGDWDAHLAKLVDFWSSMLRRTGRFTGAPVPRHAVLPGLSAGLFEHWLTLFRETAALQPNQAMAEQACLMAERMARSLWQSYQTGRDRSAPPTALTHG